MNIKLARVEGKLSGSQNFSSICCRCHHPSTEDGESTSRCRRDDDDDAIKNVNTLNKRNRLLRRCHVAERILTPVSENARFLIQSRQNTRLDCSICVDFECFVRCIGPAAASCRESVTAAMPCEVSPFSYRILGTRRVERPKSNE